jgi:DNA-binding beta-propeller fold protein YncE
VGQTVLPFAGLNNPLGVAVDTAGSVYVTDKLNHRVLKLAADSGTQTVLPFTDLVDPAAVAVDKVGNLYVSDCNTSRVWKLAAGSSTPIVLLTGLLDVFGLAVDSAGNLYGIAAAPSRVWKLAAPTTPNATPTVLPFAGLNVPGGVAVDSAGNLYVTDNDTQLGSHQVVKLTADLATQTVLPFTGLNHANGVAVDSAGNLYVTDHRYARTSTPVYVDNRVLKLAAGSGTQTVLPFTGLTGPAGVAVNPPWIAARTNSVYVVDCMNNRVLKLGLG